MKHIYAPSTDDCVTDSELTTALAKYLPLAGGTMTGDIIERNRFVKQNTDVTKGTTPSSTKFWSMYNCDKNGTKWGTNSIGFFETMLSSASNVDTYIGACQNVAGSSNNAKLGVTYNSDGSTYGFAPTPSSATDSSTKIATTAWTYGMLKQFIFGQQIVSGGSYSFSYKGKGVCFIVMLRGSAYGIYACDNWSGVAAVHSMNSVTVTCSGMNVTIKNSSSAALSMFVFIPPTYTS